MPRISITLSDNALKLLEQIQGNDDRSLSKTASQIVELGIKAYMQNESIDQNKLEEIEQDSSKHLLRILGITSDILRCVYNQKQVRHGASTADDELELIRMKVESFVDGFLEKKE